MDNEERWTAIESERVALADLLGQLTLEQWEAGSLCAQWRVRDVAAHVAMTPLGLGWASIVAGVVKARGDVWAFGRDVAREHARRPVVDIVVELRRHAAVRTLPAMTNAENALLDVLVHGQDIAIPIGIEHRMPAAASVDAFHRAWSMGWPFWARRRLRGLRLVATDTDLAVGAGEVVQGRTCDLLLLATGRTTAALPRLRGNGVQAIRS